MIEVPEQLHDFRFVLLRARSKEAFEKDWQNTANYSYDDPRLLEHLKLGGNYGVVAGSHIILETDTPELEQIVERELPPTFTQRSPGHHSKHFFYNGTSKTIPLFDKSRPKGKDNVGHVKSGPSYVVGPGCVHPNGGVYEPVDDQEIANITEEDVQRILGHYMARRALAAEKTEARKQRTAESFPILDLVSGLGLKERSGQLQGAHPIHGSETGMNFSVDPSENVWHCFRCNTGGGPWHLLAVMERIIDCQDAVPGGLRGELFKRTREIALERELVKRQVPVFTTTEETSQVSEDAEPHEAAEAILSILHVKSVFQGETYVYDGGVYKPGGEATIRRIVEANFHKAGADKTANNHFLNEVLGHVQRRTYTDPETFDPDPHVLNLENGLLNVNTFELRPHTPDYPSLAKLPVKHDPAADSPRWKQFLSEVLDPGDVNAVQEIIGSLLWKRYETQKAWLQIGEGANGKDTLDQVLISLLGPENIANHSLQSLEENRFAAASLHGKLANIYSDLKDAALKSTGIFKTLTGQGRLSAEHKFQNAFTFENYAKLIFSCNKIPLSPDDTDAFFRRWFITTFPNQFLGDRADPAILGKLTTSEELSGILNWALEGLRRLRAQRWQLSDAKSVEETRQEYVRKSDQVKAFVMECCLSDPDGAVSKQRLFQAFLLYCRGRSLPLVTDKTFFSRLPMAGVPVASAKLGPKGRQVPSFKGLWLRKPAKWGSDQEEDESPDTGQDTLPLTWTLGMEMVDTIDTPDTKPSNADSVSTISTVSTVLPPKVEVGTCAVCQRLGVLKPGRRGEFLVCEDCYS
jgi:putative DNA primase/helicase